MDFLEWSADDWRAEIVTIADPSDWDKLESKYTNAVGNITLRRVFEVAKENAVVSVLIENRYIDYDWRSEHSRFYSTTFQRYPSVCHRLHFFAEPLPSSLADVGTASASYRGYTVIRPLASAPVGRTMIAPPPVLATSGTACLGTETVDVLGWPMEVTAMPFMSQDAQYMRCAHADLWMTLQLAHLSQGLPRRLPAEIHDAARGGVIAGRQIPSEGLTPYQMLAGMTKLGLSPAQLSLPPDAAQDRAAGPLSLFGILCRYVNSNMAPIVQSDSHVWLIVGYTREPSAGHAKLTLYRHDDQLGPYLAVDDPWNEKEPAHQPWSSALLPLPPKIYMTAERAETVGRFWFTTYAQALTDAKDPLFDAFNTNELTFRTYCIPASRFKHLLESRPDFDRDVAQEYRLGWFPRNLWVVEAVDRRLRKAGKPSVLGEVLVDPTATHEPTVNDLGLLAAHAPGFLWTTTPETKVESTKNGLQTTPYPSGRNL